LWIWRSVQRWRRIISLWLEFFFEQIDKL
jgi:hypothetical protein